MHHGLERTCQGVDARPGAAVFTELRDVFRHAPGHAHGVDPRELGAVGAGDLVCRQEHGAHAVAGARWVGRAIVVDAVVRCHLVAFWFCSCVGGQDQRAEGVGVVDVGHNGATACVEALVDDVAERLGFRLEVPIDVGQAVLHVHVGHSGRFPTGRADDQVRTVALVPIHQVGRQLADAVNQHLGARTRVVGVAAAQRGVGLGGHGFPFRCEFAQTLDLEVSTRGISREGVGAVPFQIHGARRRAFLDAEVNGAQKRRGVGHGLESVFHGHLHTDVAMCKLVGVVQERGHHPSCGQHEVSSDDLRRDDVPLRAQGVLVQIKDLDLVLDKLLASHGAEHVPMQGGVASIVHVVHVGEVGRRQLAPRHHTAPPGAHQREEVRQGEDACKGGAHEENRASASMERTKSLKSTDLFDVGRVVWCGLLTAKCEWRGPQA